MKKDKMKEIAIRLAVLSELGIQTFAEDAQKNEGKKQKFAHLALPKTDKRCKVCNSPHRAEYEEYYLAVRNIAQVWAYSKTIGEEISEHTFYRHFKNHFNPEREAERLSRELFEKAVQEKINYAQKLVQKFLLADRLADTLLQKIGTALENDAELKGKEIMLLTSLLAELRQYAKQIRELEGEDEE
jgi:DNA repair exonuclease SbcCD ATPase subunit